MSELDLLVDVDGTLCVKQATKKGYIELDFIDGVGVCDLSYPSSKTRRGRVQEGGKICPTITAESSGIVVIEFI